ncbi:SMP-30/gluconolactonase/LRE family protein [Roseovarius sp.]|uniref:SMP-30/gluconolactonase/LRE family protein n=1 Tax=Roseovarius sp. TaxID=1486281 RepID=UPI0032EEA941
MFDDTNCLLGEGPLWHPLRGQLFWFDIDAHRLYTRTGEGRRMWQFEEHVSAAGWVDEARLLVASETALIDFNVETGTSRKLCDLEADNPATRSNDGRADPFGGFWIGTMSKEKAPGAGAIYRYYRGELRRLFAPWSTPNAMCFAPDGRVAYLADTPRGRIWRQALDGEGWPEGELEFFLDLPGDRYRPDGAVVDGEGRLWCAQIRYGTVSVFDPDGREVRSIAFPAPRTTCPAFGGEDLRTLFVTSARQEPEVTTEHDGRTYSLRVDVAGQPEHRVIL